MFPPGDLLRLHLSVQDNLFTVDRHTVLVFLHLKGETVMGGVITQQIPQLLRTHKGIVYSNHAHILWELESCPECESADSPQSVNANHLYLICIYIFDNDI
jgi:hypothetical protein